MPLNIIVLAKQVIDPEMPASAFQVDRENKKVVTPASIPPVVNGFDENAVEAAMRIKDVQEANVTVISMGQSFSLDVMKKPLSMGADELVLLNGTEFENVADSFLYGVPAQRRDQEAGRTSTWCSAGAKPRTGTTPRCPWGWLNCWASPASPSQKMSRWATARSRWRESSQTDTRSSKGPLPSLVTVSNELGQPRYPTLRGIMAATRKKPTEWSLSDLDVDSSQIESKLNLVDLFIPVVEAECEIIEGDTDEEAGRNLALKLREAKLI